MYNRFKSTPGNYFEYKLHSRTDEIVQRDYIQITSVDPAKKNFTIRIERRYSDRVVTGVFKRLDLTNSEDVSIENSLLRLSAELDNISKEINNSDFIFIEKQLPSNYIAVRICQHALSYFLFYLRDNRRLTRVFEVSPKIKNLVIKPPKGTKSKGLKKLSIIKGREILERRQDEKGLSILQENKKKQDDLCDTICQLESMLIELKISDNL